LKFGAADPRIERVSNAVYLGSLKSRMVQAKANRPLRQLVRIVDASLFGMLDSIEPLFLARRHDLAVDQQSGGRFMIHSIDPENVHSALASISR
jgi:hypothetical protein